MGATTQPLGQLPLAEGRHHTAGTRSRRTNSVLHDTRAVVAGSCAVAEAVGPGALPAAVLLTI
jgi:hypothetical protein